MSVIQIKSIWLILFGSILLVNGDPGTTRLLKDLFANDKQIGGFPGGIIPLVRPNEKYDEPVVVTIGLTVLSIMDLNFVDKSMTLNGWLSLGWNNSQFKWDPSKYDGVDVITLPPSMIWTPDIKIYNEISGDISLPLDQVLALIHSDGRTVWIVPKIFKTSCELHQTSSEHVCAIKFGSWVHDGHKLDLHLESGAGNETSADLSLFVSNNNWKIESAPAYKNVITYACCPEPYTDVTFHLHIAPKEKKGGMFSKLPILSW